MDFQVVNKIYGFYELDWSFILFAYFAYNSDSFFIFKVLSLFGSKIESVFFLAILATDFHLDSLMVRMFYWVLMSWWCFIPLQDVLLRPDVELPLEMETKFSSVSTGFAYYIWSSYRSVRFCPSQPQWKDDYSVFSSSVLFIQWFYLFGGVRRGATLCAQSLLLTMCTEITTS